MINVTSAAITNIGKVRENNEDNYFVNGKYRENTDIQKEEYKDSVIREKHIFAVCDGMGGEAYGEVASLVAVKSLLKFQNRAVNKYINDYIEYANKQVCNEIEKNDGARMGSTVALLYIDGTNAYGYNVGDSRIYLLRDTRLMQLSRDHTQAQSMVDMGLLNPNKMNSHSGKHRLTQHLGIFPEELVVQAFESEVIAVKENDVFILCSDGLTDMLENEEIELLANEGSSPYDTASKLVDTALERGGKDNTTVIVVEVNEFIEKRPKSFWTKLFEK